jgi:cyclic-di-AMP phosphodiesterase
MEQLGGGGHLTHAACQLKNYSIQEATERLIELIHDTLKNKGE